MKVTSESEVAQSFLTLSDPMDCSPPGSSAHGIFQARVLEWGAIAFSPIQYTNAYIWDMYMYPTLIIGIKTVFMVDAIPVFKDFTVWGKQTNP